MLASDLYVACYTLNMWSPLPPLIVFGQQPLWFWLIDYLRFYSPAAACWLNIEKLSSHKLPITLLSPSLSISPPAPTDHIIPAP